VRSHTPPKSPVKIGLRRVDGTAEITVSDSGPGLAADELDRVFERFYRADSSRARASEGAGLGLSIVAAVARAHGGDVETRSERGEGATFVIDLPARPRREERCLMQTRPPTRPR
jgi:two-component system OmpR family sensor kinase